MALARVQATPKGTVSGGTSLTCTFASPPTVGNGVVVLFAGLIANSITAVTDNRGHTYTLGRVAGVGNLAAVYYCSILTATGTPFTITVTTAGSGYHAIQAVEVSGVGTGLVVDQATGATTPSGTSPSQTNPTTGSTAALTAAEVFQAAVLTTNQGQASITVVSATPTWLQEYEASPFGSPAGEANSRIVSSAASSTAACSWTITVASSESAAVIVAFGTGGAPAAVERAETFIWMP